MDAGEQAKQIIHNVQGLNEYTKEIIIDKQIKDLEILRNSYLEEKGIPKVAFPLHPLFGRRLNRDKA